MTSSESDTISTLKRVLNTKQSPSDEHLLVVLALLSKSTSFAENNPVNDTSNSNSNRSSTSSSNTRRNPTQSEFSEFLQNHKNGIVMQFIERLILTYNNKSIDAMQDESREYESYADLAVNVLVLLENFEGCCHMLYCIIEASWIRLQRSKLKKEVAIDGNFVALIKGVLSYIISAKESDIVYERLTKGGLVKASKHALKGSHISQLFELACAVPNDLLSLTLRLVTSIWNLKSAQTLIEVNLKSLKGMIYCGLKYSSDDMVLKKSKRKEFDVERGDAMKLILYIFEDYEHIDGLQTFWSSDALPWLSLACGELTILLGRALSILESNDTSVTDDLCRTVVEWIEICEKIFLCTLSFLGKIASTFENDIVGNLDMEWESLLAIRQPMERGINSVMQFLTKSVSYSGDKNMNQMQIDAAISCIRCLGAWLAESYDGSGNSNDEDDFITNENILPIISATSAVNYCRRQKKNIESNNLLTFRDTSYFHNELFLSIIPGIVSIATLNPCSDLCLHVHRISPSMKCNIINLYLEVYEYLSELEKAIELESFRVEYEVLLQWLAILFDEFKLNLINKCTCKNCTKVSICSTLKIVDLL